MNLRNDILEALKDELDSNVNGDGAYDIDLKDIRRGITLLDDFEAIPSISFWCYQDEIINRAMDGIKTRWLHIYLYGYTSSPTDIHNLESDIEYFLDNDFTYKDDTIIKKDIPIVLYEGGTTESTDNTSMFRLDIKIKYNDRWSKYELAYLITESDDYLITESGDYLLSEQYGLKS